MNVIFNRLACTLFWSLEQRSDIDVKPKIGIRSSNYFSSAVMAILTQLGNHDSRTTSKVFGKVSNFYFEFFPAFG